MILKMEEAAINAHGNNHFDFHPSVSMFISSIDVQ